MAKYSYQIAVTYDGTKFYGAAKTGSSPNVQGTLDYYLAQFLKIKLPTSLTSRTDANVHASIQYVSFYYDSLMTDLALVRLANRFNHAFSLASLKIHVLAISLMEPLYTARYGHSLKTYVYTLVATKGGYVLPLYDQRAFFIRTAKIKSTTLAHWSHQLKELRGTLDCGIFCTNLQPNHNRYSYIEKASLAYKKLAHYYVIKIYFKGITFLYNQIRYLVGTLIYKTTDCTLMQIINGQLKDKVGPKLPGYGLKLIRIE